MIAPRRSGEPVIHGSDVTGIFTASEQHACCICGGSIKAGELAKQIGTDRYADLACVDKSLRWFVETREKKRLEAEVKV